MKRKELKNNVRIVGELLDKKVTRMNEGTADESISIELTVRTGDMEEHKISIRGNKYNKGEDGKRVISEEKKNKLFPGYDTIAKEYKYIMLEKEKGGDGTGDKVEIRGELNRNKYVDKNTGEFRNYQIIKGKFIERLKETDEFKPFAVWEAHMKILSIDEEKEDSTGNYIAVKGMVFDFLGEDIYDFRVYHEKSKAGFKKLYEEGDCTRLEGKIVNRPDTVVKEVEEDEDDVWGEVEDMGTSFNTTTITRKYLEVVKGDTRVIDTSDEEHILHEDKIMEYRRNIREREEQIMNRHKEKMAREGRVQKNIDPNVGIDLDTIPF